MAVSIGNTNTRCAVGAKGNYRQAVLQTEGINQPEDFICFLEEQFQPGIWGLLQGGIISSVVPQKTSFITEAVRQKNDRIGLRRTDAAKCNFDISGYKSVFGEDRAVCCAAALAKYKPPVIVLDFGTATTVNVINADNIFVGGAIMVGINTGLAALNRRTAQLPEVHDYLNVDILCDDTQKSLVSGAVLGAAYAVEGYVKHIREILKCTPTVIITGGSASLIAPYLGFDFLHESMLLIDGLFELYNDR